METHRNGQRTTPGSAEAEDNEGISHSSTVWDTDPHFVARIHFGWCRPVLMAWRHGAAHHGVV